MTSHAITLILSALEGRYDYPHFTVQQMEAQKECVLSEVTPAIDGLRQNLTVCLSFFNQCFSNCRSGSVY